MATVDTRLAGKVESASVVTEVKDVKLGGTASIEIGDMVVPDDGNAGYVRKVANGDTSTIATRVYRAVSASNETASADGTVKVQYARNMRLHIKATTPANLTQARIDTKVTVDVANGVITADEDDTTTGFMRIERPQGGAANFDTTNGQITVVVNE